MLAEFGWILSKIVDFHHTLPTLVQMCLLCKHNKAVCFYLFVYLFIFVVVLIIFYLFVFFLFSLYLSFFGGGCGGGICVDLILVRLSGKTLFVPSLWDFLERRCSSHFCETFLKDFVHLIFVRLSWKTLFISPLWDFLERLCSSHLCETFWKDFLRLIFVILSGKTLFISF